MGIPIAHIIFVIVAMVLGVFVWRAETLEQENRMLEQEIEASRTLDEALSETVREIRQYRHDLCALLRAIDYTLRERGSEQDGQPPGSASMASLANLPLLSAVVEIKVRQCRDAEIVFSRHFEKIQTDIPEVDLTALLQNLLENAYEANLRISDPEQRWMELELLCGEEQLEVSVRNRIAPEEPLTFRTQKPSPELHGIGTQIIDGIVSKYDGTKYVARWETEHIVEIKIIFG